MKTFEEQIIFDVTGVKTETYTNYSNFTTDKIELNKIIRLAYNQALEDAAENVCITLKESILKLKKSVTEVD